MQQTEKHKVNTCKWSPVSGMQDISGISNRIKFEHNASAWTDIDKSAIVHCQHQYCGDYDFICRDGNDISQQYYPVEPDNKRERIYPLYEMSGKGKFPNMQEQYPR